MSVFSSLRYCLGDPSDYGPIWSALAFMPFGLFFDFMDGKVARWRGKASMLGQELDSLADLVSPDAEAPNQHWLCINLTFGLDIIWSCTRCCSIRTWPPHASRYHCPDRIRPLRPNSAGTFQRHRIASPQRRFRKIKVL